jgi:endonuclease YncB( thermonuclease family)
VVDGDTIDWGWRLKIESARYRLAVIDTPETRGARCAEERALGKQAAERLRSLVAAGDVTLRVDDASDKYRRQIASLSHGGHDVGETLISEGLARPYSGRGKRGSWCGVLDLSSKP